MNDMSLKARIKSIAKEKNVSAQAVLQSYLLNRFLLRLSESSYKDKFIVKGGMLISSLVGIDYRSTMDLDTTLRYMLLTEQTVKTAFLEICKIESDDGISFTLDSISPIRDDDEYGGYRVGFYAKFGRINAPMSMDISTGDIITPGAEKHAFTDLLDESISFELWSYPIETVLAEKVETILSRSTDNTRPRDFYDVFMLSALKVEAPILSKAFKATAMHRESFVKTSDFQEILDNVIESPEMINRWDNYAKRMPYANGIEFKETVEAVRKLMESISAYYD